MMQIVFVPLFLFVSTITAVNDIANSAVPKQQFFEIILDRVENVFETPSIIEWQVRIKKVNKTRSFVGSMAFKVPIGNDFKVGLKLMKKQGGEYRYMPYSSPPTAYCDIIINDKYVYPDVLKQSDFPQDIAANCPVPPKNYTFFGAVFNLDAVPTSILGSGEYAGEISYFKDDKVIGTYRVFAYVNKV
ncbi:hypothetical protein ACKWTF_009414 [Chironomus riparius]